MTEAQNQMYESNAEAACGQDAPLLPTENGNVPIAEGMPTWTQIELAQSARARARKHVPLTKERREGFLEAIRCGVTTTRAADLVGVSRRAIYAALERDETFRRQYDDARDIAAEVIEARLEEIAMSGDRNSMATVRAAEVLLKGRSQRYRPPQPGSTKVTSAVEGRGVMSVQIGSPGPD